MRTYADDFNKYATRLSPDLIRKVFVSLPRLLGQKFMPVNVDRELRSRAIHNALGALCNARLCHRVRASSGQGVPLAADAKGRTQKILLNYPGVANALTGLVLRSTAEIEELVLSNVGGIAEQAVGQLLRARGPGFMDHDLFYYVREGRRGAAEVDYLVQIRSQVVPLEVKAGAVGSLRSLHGFAARTGCPLAVRTCSTVPRIDEVDAPLPGGGRSRYRLLSIPSYLVEQSERLATRSNP